MEDAWVRKSGNLSTREILVLTSAYASRLPVQTLGEGEGIPKANRAMLLSNQHFSWREMAWPMSVLKKGV